MTWNNEGDIVLDSLLESGTKAYVCKEMKRQCIGFEINEEYCKRVIDILN